MLKLFLIKRIALSKPPHQKPRSIKAGIWVTSPRLKLSRSIPIKNPPNIPEVRPYLSEKGNSHKIPQFGLTLDKVNQLGPARVSQGIKSAENKINNILLFLIINALESVPNQLPQEQRLIEQLQMVRELIFYLFFG